MLRVNCILQGDALSRLRMLPDESVDCVMTSPPYWGLRDYGVSVETIWDATAGCAHSWYAGKDRRDSARGEGTRKEVFGESFESHGPNGSGSFCAKCGAWKGQLGLEPTIGLFLNHLCSIFDEVRRVLKKTGTCWVNLGDKYAAGNCRAEEPPGDTAAVPDKSLCLVPFRFAVEMVRRGWILRNTIIWHKPNCMPSSVRDRFTTDFDYLFFFTKSKKYWFEQQFEKSKTGERARFNIRVRATAQGRAASPQYKASAEELRKYRDAKTGGGGKGCKGHSGNFDAQGNLIGIPGKRRMRCVWEIPTQPFPEAHFATYPEALCVTPVQAGCPEFVCPKCGTPRDKLFKRENADAFHARVRNVQQGRLNYPDGKVSQGEVIRYGESAYAGASTRCVGHTACGCGTGWRPGVVLDPFFGAGTTGVVALKLKRQFIGIELNPDYIAIATKRLQPLLSKINAAGVDGNNNMQNPNYENDR